MNIFGYDHDKAAIQRRVTFFLVVAVIFGMCFVGMQIGSNAIKSISYSISQKSEIVDSLSKITKAIEKIAFLEELE